MSFKKFLFSLLICLFIFAPTIVLAGYGLEETAGAAKLDKTAPGQLPVLIGSVLGTGLSLVGVLFFALMLYGGLTWMLARGNSEQESKALDTITAAIIGIVIVLASYAITNFVFKSIGPGTASSGGGDNNTAVECTKANNCCPFKESLDENDCGGKQTGSTCTFTWGALTDSPETKSGTCQFHEEDEAKIGPHCSCNE